MVNLTPNDRQKLVALLQNLQQLANDRERRQILELAGLKKLVPMMDLSGSPFIVTNEIVSYLSDYGRLTYDQEALGLFLNLIKTFMGVQQQEFIDILLNKYDMMTPIASLPNIDYWRGHETEENILEKIVGEDTLRPIAFLAQGLQVARSVAYIGVNRSMKRWSGTGFLISSNLILTNHHVLPNVELLPFTIFRFNYEENFRGEAQPILEYQPKANGVFHTNERLDYTLVELEKVPGNEWGWLPLMDKDVKRDDRVNIIQHPWGRPKQISLQNNYVEYVGGNVVQYVTSTLPGSSGSPVLNDGWDVVALHHAGGNLREPTTQRTYYRNEGILISKILEDLPIDLKRLIIGSTK